MKEEILELDKIFSGTGSVVLVWIGSFVRRFFMTARLKHWTSNHLVLGDEAFFLLDTLHSIRI
jgi:hypothetical protein